MESSTLLFAFAIGLLSACSLPLGTLTSAFWRPSDRVIAFLMAFGGGALLAALTIDLAGPALVKGHFYWLAGGCLLGGVAFILLDQVVNNHGGFLRKVSTTMHHLHRKEHQRFRSVMKKIRRLRGMSGFPRREAEDFARSVSIRTFPEGFTLFREGDPSDRLFIIEEGAVDLLDPDDSSHPLTQLKKNDALAHLSFFTSCPHALDAVVTRASRVWILSREAFQDLIAESEPLREFLRDFLGSEEVQRYLAKHHRLDPEKARHWAEEARRCVLGGEAIPPVHEDRPADSDEAWQAALEQLSQVPLFRRLPLEDLEFIASRSFRKTHPSGHTFYFAGELANRLYLLESGEVAQVDSQETRRERLLVPEGEPFGLFSFVTGSKHTTTSVAESDVAVRVLRRGDFDELMARSESFARAIREFVEEGSLENYLRKKHDFDADKASRWVSRAIEGSKRGKLLPTAASMTHEINRHGGAPLAIWLGILLDGIPESLVIGASILNNSTVSFSLIAGLFLSNYPEALSSSVGMRQQGMRFGRILLMWTSLMLITGIGAILGTVFFAGVPTVIFSLVEGIAAGAMLTMIAQTMLPEAYLKGGAICGIATLLGFLAAIFFKTLEGSPTGH